MSQEEVYKYLKKHPWSTTDEIGKMLNLSRATVSINIRRMKKWINTRTTPHPTRKGKKVLKYQVTSSNTINCGVSNGGKKDVF